MTFNAFFLANLLSFSLANSLSSGWSNQNDYNLSDYVNCQPGYHKSADGTTCEENVCSCPRGTPAHSGLCPEHGSDFCLSCENSAESFLIYGDNIYQDHLVDEAAFCWTENEIELNSLSEFWDLLKGTVNNINTNDACNIDHHPYVHKNKTVTCQPNQCYCEFGEAAEGNLFCDHHNFFNCKNCPTGVSLRNRENEATADGKNVKFCELMEKDCRCENGDRLSANIRDHGAEMYVHCKQRNDFCVSCNDGYEFFVGSRNGVSYLDCDVETNPSPVETPAITPLLTPTFFGVYLFIYFCKARISFFISTFSLSNSLQSNQSSTENSPIESYFSNPFENLGIFLSYKLQPPTLKIYENKVATEGYLEGELAWDEPSNHDESVKICLLLAKYSETYKFFVFMGQPSRFRFYFDPNLAGSHFTQFDGSEFDFNGLDSSDFLGDIEMVSDQYVALPTDVDANLIFEARCSDGIRATKNLQVDYRYENFGFEVTTTEAAATTSKTVKSTTLLTTSSSIITTKNAIFTTSKIESTTTKNHIVDSDWFGGFDANHNFSCPCQNGTGLTRTYQDVMESSHFQKIFQTCMELNNFKVCESCDPGFKLVIRQASNAAALTQTKKHCNPTGEIDEIGFETTITKSHLLFVVTNFDL